MIPHAVRYSFIWAPPTTRFKSERDSAVVAQKQPSHFISSQRVSSSSKLRLMTLRISEIETCRLQVGVKLRALKLANWKGVTWHHRTAREMPQPNLKNWTHLNRNETRKFQLGKRNWAKVMWRWVLEAWSSRHPTTTMRPAESNIEFNSTLKLFFFFFYTATDCTVRDGRKIVCIGDRLLSFNADQFTFPCQYWTQLNWENCCLMTEGKRLVGSRHCFSSRGVQILETLLRGILC